MSLLSAWCPSATLKPVGRLQEREGRVAITRRLHMHKACGIAKMIPMHKLHRLRMNHGTKKRGWPGKIWRLGRANVPSVLVLTIVHIMPPSLRESCFMKPPNSLGNPNGGGSDEFALADLSTPAVGRLSLYYRELQRLLDAGQTSTNSRDLAAMVNVSAAVVRRDLSSIGSMGRRGVGYDVASLAEHIGVVLGSGVHWKAVMIGVGFLGNALLRYRGFERLGFSLAAAFDTDASKIDRIVGSTKILPMAQLRPVLQELKPELAILAVPSEQAMDVATEVVGLGIQGILNFAPTTLRVSSAVAVINVDLASELQQLAFRIQNG